MKLQQAWVKSGINTVTTKNNSLVNHEVSKKLSWAKQGASYRKAKPVVTVKFNHYGDGIKLRWRLMTFLTLWRLGAWRSGCNLFHALGTLRGSMVGWANRAAMSEAANARGSHAKPVIPRPADDGRRTPAWFSERPSNTRTSSMKIE